METSIPLKQLINFMSLGSKSTIDQFTKGWGGTQQVGMEWRDVTLKEQHIRDSLKVQCLGLSAPTAGTGFGPGWNLGAASHTDKTKSQEWERTVHSIETWTQTPKGKGGAGWEAEMDVRALLMLFIKQIAEDNPLWSMGESAQGSAGT